MGIGIQPVSSAIAREFLTIGPPGKSLSQYSYKREIEIRQHGKGEGDLRMKETEMGVMWLQARECLQAPEAGGGKERTVPGDSRVIRTLLRTWSWLVKLILEF